MYRWRLTAWAKGITLETIAHEVGRDISHISRISRGLNKAPEDLKVKIAEIVGIPVEKAWRGVKG